MIKLKNLQQVQEKLIQKEEDRKQKTEEATGDLIGNKIAGEITRVSKKLPNDKTEEDAEIATTKKDAYHQKKDNKLLMN